jgi:hypothetical protein
MFSEVVSQYGAACPLMQALLMLQQVIGYSLLWIIRFIHLTPNRTSVENGVSEIQSREADFPNAN